jgi:hypothetical protein
MNTPPPQTNRLQALYRMFADHPKVGLLGWILSALLTIYLSVSANHKPDLTYLVNPAKAAVVRSTQSSALAFTFDGKPLKGDVTAAQIMFWNAGDKEIRPADVRKPLHIFTQPATRILEVQLRKTTSDVVHVDLDKSRLDNGELTVKWDILEPDDAAVIQLIYVGDEEIRIEADGKIVGQARISRVERRRGVDITNEQRVPLWLVRSILILFLIPSVSLLNAANRQFGLGQRVNGWGSLAGALILLVFLIYAFFNLPPTPPFDF